MTLCRVCTFASLKICFPCFRQFFRTFYHKELHLTVNKHGDPINPIFPGKLNAEMKHIFTSMYTLKKGTWSDISILSSVKMNFASEQKSLNG